MTIRKNLITMDEILVKRTAGKIARYFLSRVVAIVIWWLPSLFPGDQVAPKSDPPSTTDGIYPPSHHTRIAITITIHTMQKGGKIPAIAVGGGAVRQSVGRPIAVSRPDPSSTTEHRYTTSHHTKIIDYHHPSCALVVANSKPRCASQSVVAGVRIGYTPHQDRHHLYP